MASYDDISVEKLKELLDEREIPYPPKSSRKKLLQLLEENSEIPTEEEIQKMTLAKLRESMKKLGFKYPSTTVQKTREFLIGALKERASGFNLNDTNMRYVVPYSKLQPVWMPERVPLIPYLKGRTIPAESLEEARSLAKTYPWLADLDVEDGMAKVNWLEHLFAFGWAVVPGAVSKRETENLREAEWDWLESFRLDMDPNNPQVIDRNRPETWKDDYFLSSFRGIFKSRVNHQKFLWHARRLVKPYFELIHKEEDLAVSFDGAGFLPPPFTEQGTVSPWLHYDQYRWEDRFVCVQGILCLTDSLEMDGGFCFCKPDDKTVGEYFREYMQRHPASGIEWAKVNSKDPIVHSIPIQKVCARAGDLILFDSRLMHANVQSQGNYRMSLYISYQPKSNASEKIRKDRLDAFQKDMGTGHWTFGPWYKRTGNFFNKYGKDLYGPTINERPDLKEVEDLI